MYNHFIDSYSCFQKYVPIGTSVRQYKIPPGPPFEKGGLLTLRHCS